MNRSSFCVIALCLSSCSSVVSETRGDAGGSAEASVDVFEPAVDLCTAPHIVDANAVGRLTGRTTSVLVDPAWLEAGAPMPPSNGCGRPLATTSRLVLRYTPSADAYLRISLVGGARIDRIVLLDGCGPTARRLACSGSNLEPGGPYVVPLLTAAPVRAGVALTVVIATDAPVGPVVFDEIPDVIPAGRRCDPTYRSNVCEAGTSCGGGSTTRCVPDGGAYANCRREAPPCDEGLRCLGASPLGYTGRCLPAIASGAECNGSQICVEGRCESDGFLMRCSVAPRSGGPGEPCGIDMTCQPGFACVSSYAGVGSRCFPTLASGARCVPSRAGSDAMHLSSPDAVCPAGEECTQSQDGEMRCLRWGARGGPCLGDGSCDVGSTCASALTRSCVPPPAEGNRCEPMTSGQCALGAECAAGVEGPPTCRRQGTLGTRCLGLNCVDGSVCDNGVCAPPRRAGEICESSALCAVGTSCGERVNGVARCVADGASGGRCRPTGAGCDEGLACDPRERCRTAVSVGARCDDSARPTACAPGLRCDGICREAGSDGGFCRSSSPSCQAGLLCEGVDVVGVPVCVPALTLGDACDVVRVDHPNTIGACADALECGGESGARRCVPLGPSLVSCGVGARPCPPGTRCAAGVCARTIAVGERCGQDGVCAENARCDGAPLTCVADGALGRPCRATGAPCDDGLRCYVPTVGVSRCAPAVTSGAACDVGPYVVCPDGDTCVTRQCVHIGAAGGACRDSATPCDDGLRCDRGVCRRALAEGEQCTFTGTSPCAQGLSCRFEDPAARCATPGYRVEVREGVAFEDPCLVAPRGLTSPLVFQFSGRAEEVEVGASGQVMMRAPGQTTSHYPAFASAVDTPLRPGESDPIDGCVRVLGDAPNRRLVIGGGTWARGASFVRYVEWAVIAYEGTNVVEVRYAAASPGGRAWVTPRLTMFAESFSASPLRPVAGTAVRFIPQ